ncbi:MULTISPECIES: chalcone isomerase family protein [unclassified Phaeobacter]|uniref:chalcone isomerase family protein n=1 Tax=unclassified Phaeobacter TaxID=2621772 RepID=UPI003A8AD961
MPEIRQNHLRSAIAAFAVSLGVGLASAATANTGLSSPTKLGEVTFRWFGLPLYDASLYTEGQTRFDWQNPMALKLSYRRGFSRSQLMQATVAELLRLEGRRADHDQLVGKLDRCFRDVRPGDSFVATTRVPDQVALYLNGKQTCDLRHADARKRFLNIWLSPNSRAARLSSELRGN